MKERKGGERIERGKRDRYEKQGTVQPDMLQFQSQNLQKVKTLYKFIVHISTR